MNKPTTLDEYKQSIRQRLALVAPVFARAAVGDFSADVPLPAEDDELTEFLVGVQLMLETIREQIGELKTAATASRATSKIVANEKARIEAILNSLLDGLITVDTSRTITYANLPAARMLGGRVLIMGQEATQFFPLEEESSGQLVPAAGHPITQAIEQGSQITVTLAKGPRYYVHAGKKRFRVAFTITPIKRGKKITGAALSFRDITEEHNVDAAKTEIISIASHQLRTPLVTIKWYAQALLSKNSTHELDKLQAYLHQIYESNQRMIDLVDHLLNVSRIDLGTLPFKPEAVQVELLLQEVIAQLQPQVLAKTLTIKQRISHPLPAAFVDVQFMRAIFQNLLTNAVRYSRPGQEVIVTMHEAAGGIKISVEDKGIGIPRQEQPKIFTKLFRAHNALQVSSDGSGLGLYITKAMVERSGGRVWFESVEGQGSTFYVTIPAVHEYNKEN